MSVFKKIPAVLTALSIVAVCTGCGSNTTTAMTVDDYVVPAGVYLYYLNSSYSNALSQLSQENENLDTQDIKTIQTLYLENKDIRTWVEDKATELCIDFVTTEKKFDELGLELDAETQEQLSSMMDYYWSYYSDSMPGIGISQESFNKVMTSSYKSEAIFDYYYAVGAEEGVTEEELQDYYAENNIRTQYIKFDLHDNEGNLMEADKKSEILKLAKEYQTRAENAYRSGGAEAVMTEMNYIQEDYNYYMTSVSEQEAGITGDELTTTAPRVKTTQTTTSTTSATEAMSEENQEETSGTEIVTEETTTNSTETTESDASDFDSETETTTVPYANESIISIIHTEDYENEEEIPYTPSEAVYQKLLEITAGDYGKTYLVEEEEAYYLVTRYDIRERITEEDLWTENTNYSVRIAMYSDAFEEKMDEWSSVLNVEKNAASYKRYDPFEYHIV